MKKFLQNPVCRFWILVLTFAAGTSVGWIDKYYWRLRWRYVSQGGLAMARAYARDFEKLHGSLPSKAELIPFAEERFKADLQRMDFYPGGDFFTWKPEKSP